MQKEISLQRTTLYREKLESKPVRKKREEGEILAFLAIPLEKKESRNNGRSAI